MKTLRTKKPGKNKRINELASKRLLFNRSGRFFGKKRTNAGKPWWKRVLSYILVTDRSTEKYNKRFRSDHTYELDGPLESMEKPCVHRRSMEKKAS
jgi:hypothetical protein